jgi:hypothetical protein
MFWRVLSVILRTNIKYINIKTKNLSARPVNSNPFRQQIQAVRMPESFPVQNENSDGLIQTVLAISAMENYFRVIALSRCF